MSTVIAHHAAQGTDLWHALRAQRYGASETPQIGRLGGSETRVWRAKLGQREHLDALFLEMGHRLESWAAELWSRAMRRDIEPGAVLVEQDGWLLASLDFSSRAEPVECKVVTRGAPDFDAWTAETVPAAKELQVRQQAALSERYTGRRLEAGHISALFLDGYGVTHRTYRIALTPERREQWADVWAPYPGRWHAAYVETRQPPPDATTADVAVFVEPTSVRQREATAEELALVGALAAAEAERKARTAEASVAEKARNGIRDDLARRLGAAHSIPGLQWKPRKNLDPLLTLEKSP